MMVLSLDMPPEFCMNFFPTLREVTSEQMGSRDHVPISTSDSATHDKVESEHHCSTLNKAR